MIIRYLFAYGILALRYNDVKQKNISSISNATPSALFTAGAPRLHEVWQIWNIIRSFRADLGSIVKEY